MRYDPEIIEVEVTALRISMMLNAFVSYLKMLNRRFLRRKETLTNNLLWKDKLQNIESAYLFMGSEWQLAKCHNPIVTLANALSWQLPEGDNFDMCNCVLSAAG